MSLEIKVSGAWRTISRPYIKDNGVWKRPTNIYYKVNGIWKNVYFNGSSATYYFCPYHKSLEEHNGSAYNRALYGILCKQHIGKFLYSDIDKIYTICELPQKNSLCDVIFDYPPASGFSDKPVYITYVDDSYGGYTYKINNAHFINAGTYQLQFTGSSFNVV